MKMHRLSGLALVGLLTAFSAESINANPVDLQSARVSVAATRMFAHSLPDTRAGYCTPLTSIAIIAGGAVGGGLILATALLANRYPKPLLQASSASAGERYSALDS